MRKAMRTVMLLAAGALGPAACSLGATGAGNATGSSASATAATAPGDFCTLWKQVAASDATLPSNFVSANKSGGVSSLKVSLALYFMQVSHNLVAAKDEAASAPADVRSSLTSEGTFLMKMQAEVDGAISIGQITTYYQTLQANAQVQGDLQVLNNYVDSHCPGIVNTSMP